MKTTSLHNQSTSQTPSGNEPTQTLPDPSQTQRIAWTPPNSPLRLNVTPGGGPRSDPRARRDLLRGVAALLLTLFVLWHLPHSSSRAKLPVIATRVVPRLVQQATPAPVFEAVPRSLYQIQTGSDEPVRVYLVAPSVPMSE